MERIRFSWRRTMLVLAALVLAFGLAGCEMITGALNGGDGGGSKAQPTLGVNPSTVALGLSGSNLPASQLIGVTAKDSTGNLESFTVSILDTTIVSTSTQLSQSFRINALKDGATVVTVKSKSGVERTIDVSVAPAAALNPPSGFAYSNVTHNSVDLNWNALTGTGYTYNVGRKAAGETTYTQIGSVVDDNTLTDATNVKASTTYSYRLQVKRNSDSTTSSWTSAITVTTPAAPVLNTPPVTPAGLTVSNPTASSLDLTWTAGADATAWDVQKSTASTGPWTSVSTGLSSPKLTIPALASSTTYYFQVRASNNAGSSGWSTAASGTTTAAATQVTSITAAPVVSIGAITPSSVQIKWQGVPGATKWEVQKVTATGGLVMTLVDNLYGSDYTENNLAASTTYYYQVRGKNEAGGAAGTGPWSATIAASTSAAVTGVTKPASSPSLFIDSVGRDFIQLRWNAIPGATAYDLKYTANGVTYSVTAYNQTTFTLVGLLGSTSYEIKAVAWNAAGSALPGTPVTALTTAAVQNMPPLSPSALSAYPTTSNTAYISWTPSPGALGYTIYRQEPIYAGTTIYSYVGQTDQYTSYFIDSSTLMGGTQYQYKVVAWNSYGENFSVTMYYSPNTGTGLVAPYGYLGYSNGTSYVELDWYSVTGASFYRVEASTDGVNWSYITETTYTYAYFYGLNGGVMANGTTYHFRVTVFNTQGYSAVSNTFDYTTPPAAASTVDVKVHVN